MALAEIVRSSERSAKPEKFRFWGLFHRAIGVASPSLQWALGAACVVLCVTLFVLTLRNHQLNRDLQEARSTEAQLRTEKSDAVEQIARLNQSTGEPPNDGPAKHAARNILPDLTFTLVAGIVRGESRQEVLIVPRDRPWIRFEMPIDEDAFKNYEAVLYTVEMHEVRRGESLRSRSTSTGIKVGWRIPSDLVESGDYILELNGKQDDTATERVSVYGFRVVHK